MQQNIAAFGGDPKKVIIAGESAGASSVCAQMASPRSKNLLGAAIGESGSMLSLQPPTTLAQAEEMGVSFTKAVGAASLAALRAVSADQLLQATASPEAPRFRPIVDGCFLSGQGGPLELLFTGKSRSGRSGQGLPGGKQ